MRTRLYSLINIAAQLPVYFYRNFLSLSMIGCCRFYPTCSEYTLRSIRKHGPIKGWFFGLKRICRCHPLSPGGIDLVK